jgi:hypothetical protein
MSAGLKATFSSNTPPPFQNLNSTGLVTLFAYKWPGASGNVESEAAVQSRN